jgi:hypothetical protein
MKYQKIQYSEQPEKIIERAKEVVEILSNAISAIL